MIVFAHYLMPRLIMLGILKDIMLMVINSESTLMMIIGRLLIVKFVEGVVCARRMRNILVSS